MSAEGEKAAEEPKPVEAPAAPVFGSAATFTGTGFGGFTLNAGVAGKGGESPSDAPANGGGEEASSSGNADADPEAECQAEFKPLVTLEEVATKCVPPPPGSRRGAPRSRTAAPLRARAMSSCWWTSCRARRVRARARDTAQRRERHRVCPDTRAEGVSSAVGREE